MLKNKKFLEIIIIGIFVVAVFSAFGCKEEEPAEETAETIDTTPDVTYTDTSEDANGEAEASDDTAEQTSENDSSANGDSEAGGEVVEAVTDDDKILLEQAEKLAEIFGTFTNKDKESYKNLSDLKQYSTDNLQKWFSEKMETPIDPNAPFYGITTKSISSAIVESTAESREILVTVRREEITSETVTPEVSYHVLLMTFEQVAGEWKLSGIYWQT